MQKSDAVRGIALFRAFMITACYGARRIGRQCRAGGIAQSRCAGGRYLFCLRLFLSLAIGAAQSAWMEPAVRMLETASLTVL